MANIRSDGSSAVIIGVLLVTLLAFLIPAVIIAQDTPDSLSVEQAEDEIFTLTPGLDASLDRVEATPQPVVNVTLIDTQTGETNATGELSEGNTATVTIGGETVTVTANLILDKSTAIMVYTYPLYYGWPDGIKFLVENIVLIILMLTILLIAVMVIAAIDLGDIS